MKKLLSTLILLLTVGHVLAQQTELTTAEAKKLYKATTKKRVSVHDPSIVYDSATNRYYIFGTHRGCARTSDLQNWTSFSSPWKAGNNNNAGNNVAFVTPAVKKVMKGGVEVDFPQFNAMDWAARSDAGYNINGNMWAPDVIWNPTMQKWCQYLSVNGDRWHSSIILLTSDNIEGPYLYQGPVVISGFYDSQHPWKITDLELVLGTQASLPSRYNTSGSWGNRYPNDIDPCVFYDEEGKLWMAYGSWSGGIWLLELNEENGLRDYDVEYKLVGSGDDITTDPYFGKKIAGGHYVSGEGSYIEYVNGYYYLFVTYGGLDSVGGYVMRLFRSKSPNGPYVDAASHSAIFNSYKMNYGKNADNRGVKVMGAYDHWGFMSGSKSGEGELSQGHNSIIAAHDGRTYLVYHTRFNNGGEGHQVRVHQMFQTKNGWLVASPFEYNGDTLTDASIASRELFTKEEITGTYQVLVHKYDIDYKNREVVEPVKIVLNEDGTVTGKYAGVWSTTEGTSYLSIRLGATTYNAVIIEQQMDQQSIKTIAFTGLSTSGVTVWGYKMHPKYALAWQLNNQKMPFYYGQRVKADVDFDGLWQGDENVTVAWTSGRPDIIDEHGHFNNTGLAEETEVPITVRITSCNYYWQFETMIKAQPDPNIDAIDEVADSPFTLPNAVYDLQGRRVYTRDQLGADLLKGLYIVNGKLILKR